MISEELFKKIKHATIPSYEYCDFFKSNTFFKNVLVAEGVSKIVTCKIEPTKYTRNYFFHLISDIIVNNNFFPSMYKFLFYFVFFISDKIYNLK